jgi:sortase A
MPDRRTVDELTIEELEQILLVKRREARAGRARRLHEIGRLPADTPLLHEDLASLASPGQPQPTEPLTAERQRNYELAPVGRRGQAKKPRLRAARSPWQRMRDRALLVLEVGALLGLVGVVVASLLNMQSLNADYVSASGADVPTPTATPLAGGILPGGHAPPEEPGEVPTHLRGLVSGQVPPAIAIPTPGPEAPTRIVIPAIKVDALIVQGDGLDQLKLGVGHASYSANPGERGNMVLSAHNDIYGEIFRRLPDLELGDEVIVYAGDHPYRYVVTAKQIIDESQVEVLAPTTKPVVTLISCYPYMVDTHRIAVVAELQ